MVNRERSSPILVTGSHRSGSTWVGRMLALPANVAYIHEPFNLHHRPGVCKATFENWFPYICAENEAAYIGDIADVLRYKYHLQHELRAVHSLKDVLRLGRDYTQFARYRWTAKRSLVKDPIAFFSAEWLARTFAMDVVVLIRHPAAFAGSLKKANWDHPFDHFLRQPLLMRDHLAPFKTEIEAFADRKQDVIAQAILLWNLIHHVILNYMERYPRWTFVKHEDLSRHPIKGFGKLYQQLDLPFSETIRKKIAQHSGGDSNIEETLLMRDSRANIFKWKERLTIAEINKVREETDAIAQKFYSAADWRDGED